MNQRSLLSTDSNEKHQLDSRKLRSNDMPSAARVRYWFRVTFHSFTISSERLRRRANDEQRDIVLRFRNDDALSRHSKAIKRTSPFSKVNRNPIGIFREPNVSPSCTAPSALLNSVWSQSLSNGKRQQKNENWERKIMKIFCQFGQSHAAGGLWIALVSHDGSRSSTALNCSQILNDYLTLIVSSNDTYISKWPSSSSLLELNCHSCLVVFNFVFLSLPSPSY